MKAISKLLLNSLYGRWASENLLYSKGSYSYIGNKNSSEETHLFSNYLAYCNKYKYKPISFHKFSYTLIDVCSNQLGWDTVGKKELHQGFVITDIVINTNPVKISREDTQVSKVDLSFFGGVLQYHIF
jgi:hypothetical protein